MCALVKNTDLNLRYMCALVKNTDLKLEVHFIILNGSQKLFGKVDV
jgi:hypothetical protein